MIKQPLITALLSLTLVVGLSSCGFQLRDNYQLPTTIQQMQVTAAQSVELRESLQQRLLSTGIKNVTEQSAATTSLNIISDKLERRTLSLFESGQVAEYELLYQVRYEVMDKGQRVYQDSVEVARDYQDDPNFALAKTRERELLVSEMRDDAARRIVRQIISHFSQ